MPDVFLLQIIKHTIPKTISYFLKQSSQRPNGIAVLITLRFSIPPACYLVLNISVQTHTHTHTHHFHLRQKRIDKFCVLLTVYLCIYQS